ncbi:hypothetical protein MKZ38_002735 [Zalerion maritima]|uniref:Ubiquinone biosynthesis protein n=1 Tax=Zalerion maritima TaxID=339359 RepID=A0AAD5RQ53_9PEZI|nr:hypothetical protein MKZ38_002735 [Zalerion maritima]
MHPPTPSSGALRRLGTQRWTTAAKTSRQCAAIHMTTRATVPSTKQTLPSHAVRAAVAAPSSPTLPTVTQTAQRRTFHSTDHPPPPGPFGATESALLAAAYQHVPEHGFSSAALAFGARDAGFPDISTSVLPDGEFGLIRWHLELRKAELAGRAEEMFVGEGKGKEYKIPEKIEMLIWERLTGNKEVIGQWQQALAIMASPTNVPVSIKHLAELADEIVYLSGDKAVDPSWYSSRAGVSAIYASTELFMTSDKSEGFTDTRQFLRRRMEEARGVKGALGNVGQWVGFSAMGALNVARSWGVRV